MDKTGTNCLTDKDISLSVSYAVSYVVDKTVNKGQQKGRQTLMNMFRVACLGAGYFAQFHFDAWQRAEQAELVAVVDKEVTKAEAAGVAAFGALDEMITATQPDILDVILPPDQQADAIRTAIKRNIKTVICQKPFCRSRAEAQTITAAAADAGLQLIIHENFRFQPWYQLMKEQLQTGAVGTPYQFHFSLRPNDGRGKDAYLSRQPYFQTMPRFLVHETAIHFLDVFTFLFGRPDTVYADLQKRNPVIAGEDAGHILLGYDDGKRAIFDGNRLADHKADNHRLTMGEALLEGSVASLSLNGFGVVTQRLNGSTDSQLLLSPQKWAGFGGDCVYRLTQHILHCLAAGKPPANTAQDYLRLLALEELVYQSAETGQRLRVAP